MRPRVIALALAGALLMPAGALAEGRPQGEARGQVASGERAQAGMAQARMAPGWMARTRMARGPAWPQPAENPALPMLPADAPLPDRGVVARRLAPEAADKRLGPRVSVVVRDVASGEVIHDDDAAVPRTPASTTKLLSAAAVATTVDLDDTLRTRAVLDPAGPTVVLVAGGDTLLSPGAGRPDDVLGRAGLGDLAGQVAAQLTARGVTSVRLAVDDSRAKGPLGSPSWDPAYLPQGWTGPIAMLGLATHRAAPYVPAPADPVGTTTQAFRKALTSAGLTITGKTGKLITPDDAPLLGEVHSAPIREQLGYALLTSDNSLTETLARYAAWTTGLDTTADVVPGFVTDKLGALGIDVSQVRLKDASGLGEGASLPPSVLADLVVLAASGRDQRLLDAFGGLPVGGLSGTLHNRFHLESAAAGRGVVRAKTGSLPKVTTLAGVVETASGRELAFVVMSDGYPESVNALDARAAVDDVVAALAGCGC